MSQPLLSVIIPCYQAANHLRTLTDRLDLASQESLENVQFVIVYADSFDGTQDAIVQLQTQRSDILALEVAERIGPGEARNLGLEVSNGQFVAFFDVDDQFNLAAYMQLATALRAGNSHVGAGAYQVLDISRPPHSASDVRRLPPNCHRITDLLEQHAGVWRYVFSRSWLRDHQLNFPLAMFGEDLLFLLDIDACAPIITFSNDVMCTYFVGQPSQASSPKTSHSRRPELLTELAIRAPLRKEDPQRMQIIAFSFLRVWGVGFRDGDARSKFNSLRQLAIWRNSGNSNLQLLKELPKVLGMSRK